MVSNVEKERPRADTRVEAAVGIAKKRKRTNSCIPGARGKAKEGLLALRRVELGIAPIGRRNNAEKFRRNRRTEER